MLAHSAGLCYCSITKYLHALGSALYVCLDLGSRQAHINYTQINSQMSTSTMLATNLALRCCYL